MANVRDYLKRKKDRPDQEYRISYREKIKSHKFTIFYRTILVLVLIGAIAAAMYIQWKNKIYTQMAVVASAEIHITQDAHLLPFAGYLLTYSKDGAGCMDIKGNAVWNQTFEMQNPMVDMCQNVVAIGDYNGRSIYVMDTGGVMGNITTNKPVRDFCVSSNGVVAVVLDDTDTTWIYLYDAKGKELVYFRTTMKDSGYPIKVSISPNAQLVCVSYLFVDSGQMKSSVAFYNFGDVGQNSTNNYVSGYDYLDAIVPLTDFLDNKSLFAVSDDRIMFYGGAQKPVVIAESLISETVQSVYYGDEYVGLVFISSESSSRYRLDVYHKSGEFRQSIEFDIDYRDILFREDQIIIYNESECRIYNSNGTEKYSGRFEKSALVLIPQSNAYRYMIVTPDSIDTVELQ
ncbi:MAG: hypothetical protein J1F42_14215 [Lachnospiraceae bacterium]|nr:hypothetical protein [Lachnospiraceae bacterium]